ncbi:MAG: tetratricopeptide repeat protein, partial [Candidatus Babeliales bacterium]|nr:tetratricopeptide repeat protein [Candidatus Babeliales bacterium]
MFFLIIACFLVAPLLADDISNALSIDAITDARYRAELHPNEHQAWLDLADKLEKKELLHEANQAIKKASLLQPHDIFIVHRYAISCIGIGLVDQAIEAFQSLLKQFPNNLQIIYNIGYTLKMAGHVHEAIECYQKVLAIDPHYEAASFALGHALLFKGDFKQGWKQHELHLKKTNKNSEQLRQFIEKNSLQGKKILLRFDGGMGDTLQFIRYAQLIKNLGATVFAQVQKPLIP